MAGLTKGAIMARVITKLTLDEMLAEIKRRRKTIAKLNRKRDALLKKLAAVDAEIKANGGAAVGGATKAPRAGAKRPRNEMSLVDAMASVMSKEQPMSASDIEKAVLKKGYQSGSSNFKTIIFQALGKDKRFKKAARGQYVLK